MLRRATTQADELAQLLRVLRNPSALRASLTARPLFAGGTKTHAVVAERVRAALRVAIAEMPCDDLGGMATIQARRRRTILERCDLLGEPRERVYRDLGLSARQFFRERRSAIAGVAERTMRELGVACAPTLTVPDAFELRTEQAMALRAIGAYSRAATIFAELIAAAPDPRRTAMVHTELIATYAQDARQYQMRGALQGLYRLRATAPDEIVEGEVLLAESIVALNLATPLPSLSPERVGTLVTRCRGTKQGDRIGVGASLCFADRRLHEGNVDEARQLLQSAEEVVIGGSTDHETRVEFLALYARLDTVTGDPLAAIGKLEHALAVARTTTSTGQIIYLLAALGRLHHGRGSLALAHRYASAALAICREGETQGIRWNALGVMARFVLTEIEISAGRAEAASAMLSEAPAVAEGDLEGANIARRTESSIQLALGNPLRAYRIAHELVEATPAWESELAGAGWLLAGEASAAVGDIREALPATKRAIEILSSGKRLFTLSRAYFAYARCTGAARDLARARDMAARLRS